MTQLSKTLIYEYLRSLFQCCRMWIFPWIKLSWHSCSMWNKFGWLSWFWQFLCDRLSSFNVKRFYYSYAWPCSLCERRTSFSTGLISRKLCGFLLLFSTSFTSLSVLLFPLYWSPFSSLCMACDSISGPFQKFRTWHLKDRKLILYMKGKMN